MRGYYKSFPLIYEDVMWFNAPIVLNFGDRLSILIFIFKYLCVHSMFSFNIRINALAFSLKEFPFQFCCLIFVFHPRPVTKTFAFFNLFVDIHLLILLNQITWSACDCSYIAIRYQILYDPRIALVWYRMHRSHPFVYHIPWTCPLLYALYPSLNEGDDNWALLRAVVC